MRKCEVIFARALSIFSTLPGNQYGTWSGTPMATPFVAACAARLTISYLLSDPAQDTVDPVVEIVEPPVQSAYHTSAEAITLSGTAWDNVAVTRVGWSSDRGGSGEVEGTREWTVEGVPLQHGQNHITVTAYDAEGNSGEASVDVVRNAEETPVRVDLAISTGDDDTWEKTYNGVNSTTNKSFYLSNTYICVFRFTNVSIPAGATITKACLMFHCRDYEKETVSLWYTGEKTADAAPFTGKRLITPYEIDPELSVVLKVEYKH